MDAAQCRVGILHRGLQILDVHRLRCVRSRDICRCRSRSSCLNSGDRSNELVQLGGQPADRRMLATSAPRSAEIQPHHHAWEPTGDSRGVSSFGEAGVLEELARADVGHREVDFLAAIVYGITLNGWRTL